MATCGLVMMKKLCHYSKFKCGFTSFSLFLKGMNVIFVCLVVIVPNYNWSAFLKISVILHDMKLYYHFIDFL